MGKSAGQPEVQTESLCGLIVVDKPVGCSSMDVVRRVRRAAKGAKTGHAGTLDPLASGVVICALGKATRSIEHLMGLTKIYEARVDLSALTTTDDLEGEREEVAVASPPDPQRISKTLQDFVGNIRQKPPRYSAIHIDGQRAYKLARKGKAFEVPERQVVVHAIDVLGYDWPMLDIRVTCGKGTYIRSLARDIGLSLGTGGHLASLRRTAVGAYTLSGSYPMDRLPEPITRDHLRPMPVLLPDA
ncbi:MAG: tRNA pseudouridine(55) synthase TruB [Phycisphaera sp.]|nr:tRNA pseudouridine(55) synthase TruB [Phycisphaera sp.]